MTELLSYDEDAREAVEDLERTTVHWSNSGEDSRSAWLRRRADKEEQG